MAEENAHEKIMALICEMVELDEWEKISITQHFEPVRYRKKQVLVKEKGQAPYMYFINAGYVRTYYHKDGEEVTDHINCPLGFMTAYGSYTTGTPSHECMECITDCDLLRIRKEVLDDLVRQSPKWAEAARIINERVVLYNEQRTRDMVGKTAEERYLQLLQEHPDFLRYVPLQYIASFIGVKPESLSRIRRNVANPA